MFSNQRLIFLGGDSKKGPAPWRSTYEWNATVFLKQEGYSHRENDDNRYLNWVEDTAWQSHTVKPTAARIYPDMQINSEVFTIAPTPTPDLILLSGLGSSNPRSHLNLSLAPKGPPYFFGKTGFNISLESNINFREIPPADTEEAPSAVFTSYELIGLYDKDTNAPVCRVVAMHKNNNEVSYRIIVTGADGVDIEESSPTPFVPDAEIGVTYRYELSWFPDGQIQLLGYPPSGTPMKVFIRMQGTPKFDGERNYGLHLYKTIPDKQEPSTVSIKRLFLSRFTG